MPHTAVPINKKYFLAIDPGLANIGYTVVEIQNKQKKLLYGGVIITDKPRLKHIYYQIEDIIISQKLEFCVLENVFVRNGAKSSLNLAAARGVVVLLCQIYNVKLYEVNSNTVRKAILGSGKANKEEVQNFIKKILLQQNIFIQKLNHNLADAILLSSYSNFFENNL